MTFGVSVLAQGGSDLLVPICCYQCVILDRQMLFAFEYLLWTALNLSWKFLSPCRPPRVPASILAPDGAWYSAWVETFGLFHPQHKCWLVQRTCGLQWWRHLGTVRITKWKLLGNKAWKLADGPWQTEMSDSETNLSNYSGWFLSVKKVLAFGKTQIGTLYPIFPFWPRREWVQCSEQSGHDNTREIILAKTKWI